MDVLIKENIDKIIARHKLIPQGKKFKSDFFVGEIAENKVLALMYASEDLKNDKDVVL